MDVSKILTELRDERQQIEEAIVSLERLARGRGRKRGRPPAWAAGEAVPWPTAGDRIAKEIEPKDPGPDPDGDGDDEQAQREQDEREPHQPQHKQCTTAKARINIRGRNQVDL